MNAKDEIILSRYLAIANRDELRKQLIDGYRVAGKELPDFQIIEGVDGDRVLIPLTERGLARIQGIQGGVA